MPLKYPFDLLDEGNDTGQRWRRFEVHRFVIQWVARNEEEHLVI